MRVGLLRRVGVATAAYGIAVAVWPKLLATPSGLADDASTRTSLRPLGWRGAAGGAALAPAPEGPALRTAAVLRIAADLGDAALLGATLPGRGRRRAAVAVSVGWGALSAAGLLWPAGRDEVSRRRRRAGSSG
ncbi:hypothetical protein [Streptomyces specialis]|uniref:hypothetical protein n=1 Tax=Streptomyces specialis TaxID=498367 RepID=UPI00073F2729|nr:hypothetical protein [Streptomyces specialis]